MVYTANTDCNAPLRPLFRGDLGSDLWASPRFDTFVYKNDRTVMWRRGGAHGQLPLSASDIQTLAWDARSKTIIVLGSTHIARIERGFFLFGWELWRIPIADDLVRLIHSG
jgi:hypothetical protein